VSCCTIFCLLVTVGLRANDPASRPVILRRGQLSVDYEIAEARESLLIFGVGAGCGLPLSFLVSRLLRSQLYQLSYLDSTSFALAIALTSGVAVASALLPARRAAKVDPMVALRYE